MARSSANIRRLPHPPTAGAATPVALTPTGGAKAAAVAFVSTPRPLALDPSTPQFGIGGISANKITSNAFSPPAGSLIIVIANAAAFQPFSAASITDSLGVHLNWTKVGEALNGGGGAMSETVWAADCLSAQAGMTVTASFATASTIGGNDATIAVFVYTGAKTVVGQVGGFNFQNALGAPSIALTAAAAGSAIIGGWVNWTNNTAPTIPGGQTATFNGNSFLWNDPSGSYYWCQQQSAFTAAPGSVTLNATAPTGVALSGVAVEVEAAYVTSVPALTPTAGATAQAAATLTAPALLVASAQATSTATVQARAPALLTATAGSTAAATNAVTAAGKLTLTAGAQAQATAALQAPALLVATAQATATATGAITAAAKVAPSAQATTTASAAITAQANLTASAQAVSTATATVTSVGVQNISLQAGATTQAIATLTAPAKLTASAAATTTAQATVAAPALLTATAQATSTAVAQTTAAAVLAPTAQAITAAGGYQAIAADDFNRANGGLGTGWTAFVGGSDVAMAIVSNQAKASAASGVWSGSYRTDTYGNDQFAQLEVAATPGPGDWIGVTLRTLTNGQNGYRFIYFNNAGTYELRIGTRASGTGGTLTTLSLGSSPLPIGTALRLVVTGNFFRLFQNGVLVLTATDNTFLAGGAPGLIMFNSTAAITGAGDNYQSGNAVPAALPLTALTLLTAQASAVTQATCAATAGGISIACTAQAQTAAIAQTTAQAKLTLTAGATAQATALVAAPTKFTASAQAASQAVGFTTAAALLGGAGGAPPTPAFTLTSVASDNFNRANGALSGNWAAAFNGGLSISSNEVIGASVIKGDYRTGETYGSDQYSRCTIGSVNSGAGNDMFIGLTVRNSASANDNYLGIYNWHDGTAGRHGELSIWQRTGAGTNVLMALKATADLVAGQVLTFAVVGSRLSLQVDGVEQLAAVDPAPLSGGTPGIELFLPVTLDNWEGGNAVYHDAAQAGAIVQHKAAPYVGATTVTSLSITFDNPVTPGNKIAVFAGWTGGGSASATDDDSDSVYRLRLDHRDGASSYSIGFWEALVHNAGTRTVTFNFLSGARGFARLFAVELSGVNNVDQLIGVEDGASTASPDAGALLAQHDGEVALAWIVPNNGYASPGAGWTTLETVGSQALMSATGLNSGTSLEATCAAAAAGTYTAIALTYYKEPGPIFIQAASQFQASGPSVDAEQGYPMEKDNAVVVCMSWASFVGTWGYAVADAVGSTFTEIDHAYDAGLGFDGVMTWAKIAGNGGHGVIFTPGAASGHDVNYQRLMILEYANVQGVDVSAHLTGLTGTDISIPALLSTLPTTKPSEVTVGQAISNNGTGPGGATMHPGSARRATSGSESAYDAVVPTSGATYYTGFVSATGTTSFIQAASLTGPAVTAGAGVAAQATTQATATVTAITGASLNPVAQASTQATLTLTAPTLITATAQATATAQTTVAAATRFTATAQATSQAQAQVTTTAPLIAAAAATSQATAVVTAITGQALFPAAVASTSATTQLTTSSLLTATAAATSQAQTTVTAGASLTATAQATTQTVARLFAPARLTATAQAAASAVVTQLVTGEQLVATAQAQTQATLTLTVPGVVLLSLSASAATAATAALNAPTLLGVAAAQASAQALAQVTIPVALACSAQASSQATGTLRAASQLTPAAAAQTQAMCAIASRTSLTATAVSTTTATAQLTAPVRLTMTAASQSAATAQTTAASMLTLAAGAQSSATARLAPTFTATAQAVTRAVIPSLIIAPWLEPTACAVTKATATVTGIPHLVYMSVDVSTELRLVTAESTSTNLTVAASASSKLAVSETVVPELAARPTVGAR